MCVKVTSCLSLLLLLLPPLQQLEILLLSILSLLDLTSYCLSRIIHRCVERWKMPSWRLAHHAKATAAMNAVTLGYNVAVDKKIKFPVKKCIIMFKISYTCCFYSHSHTVNIHALISKYECWMYIYTYIYIIPYSLKKKTEKYIENATHISCNPCTHPCCS